MPHVKSRIRRPEQLESRLCLTSLSFAVHLIGAFDGEVKPRETWLMDLDGDSDTDVVVGAATGIWTYENTGAQQLARKSLVDASYLRAHGTAFVDMDQDGRLDIHTQYRNGRWAWFRQNDDGSFDQRPRSSLGSHQFADLDGDGDLDGIALLEHGGFHAGRFVWIETAGSELASGPKRAIPVPVTGRSHIDPAIVPTVHPMDVDQDGDLDLLAIPNLSRPIHWLENLDGHGTFGPPQVIKNTRTPRPVIADFDNDGDLDVIIASIDHHISDLTWIGNEQGVWQYAFDRVPSQRGYVTGLLAGDIDADGRLDLIVQTSAIGVPLLWHRQLLDTSEVRFAEAEEFVVVDDFDLTSLRLLAADDLDGDGDVDLLVGRTTGAGAELTEIHWLESLLVPARSTAGDINGDALVSFDDFLILAANYGRKEAARSDGDLDADGRVTFADFLVLAAEYTVAEGNVS